MNGRTIATHGGGDLVIGGGPPIDGVLHGWFYPEGQRGPKGAYGFMLGHDQAEDLQECLGHRRSEVIRTFDGSLRVSFVSEDRRWLRRDGELAYLWFYPWREATPNQVIRLYDGAIDAAIDAIGEALNPMAPMPAGLHDASLTAAAREELEQLLAEGLVRKAA